jgi:ABC-2 type transport system ATP-binding protein
VGTLLEASSAHRGRTALNHLRIICDSAGYPQQRAAEVLDMVGLTSVGGRSFRGFSLGMRQRLGIAAAMIGDPRVLLLDEPANGLDPEGIHWMRQFLRALAGQGRTVLVSSHLLSEVQQLADEVIIIAHGKLVAQGRTETLVAQHTQFTVRVRTPDPAKLAEAVHALGATSRLEPDGAMIITGLDAARVGHAALQAQVELHELVGTRPDLEQVFLTLTHGKAGLS